MNEIDQNINKQMDQEKVSSEYDVTKEEFDKKAERESRGTTSFRGTKIGGSEQKVDFFHQGDKVEIDVDVDPEIASQISNEIRDNLGIDKNGGKIHYSNSEESIDRPSRKPQQENDNTDSMPPPEYYVDGLPQTYFPETDQSKITRTNVNELKEKVKDLEGNQIVFYTGAGISQGGEAPVWGMGQFAENMHMGSVDDFFTTLAYNPDAIADSFNTFNKSFYEDVSTPAHIAIADIARETGAHVLTENLDLKHEAEGSRYRATHMSRGGAHEVVKNISRDAKILITVGLSQDDRSAITALKKANPELDIVAFSLPQSESNLPSYLDEDNSHAAVIEGDAQELLPQLRDSLIE